MILIIAVDQNWGIGKDNKMLFHLKKDLAHFRQVTLGKIVIMGRKTYDSIGHALPDRDNLVLSQDQSLELPDAKVFNRVFDILNYTIDDRSNTYVIGGAKIADLFLDVTQKAIITKIFDQKDADTYLHNFDTDHDFEIIHESEVYEEDGIKFQIVTYERIKNGNY